MKNVQKQKQKRSFFQQNQTPILILSVLISGIIHYEYNNILSFSLFLLIVLFNLLICLSLRKLHLFFISLSFASLSLLFHHFNQHKLSQNIFPQKARYLAQTEDLPLIKDQRTRLILNIEKRLSPVPEPVSGRVQMTIDKECWIPPQSQIEFLAPVKIPSAFKNPGVFHYRNYLQRNDIWGTVFIKNCDDIFIVHKSKLSFLEKRRYSIYQHLLKNNSPYGPIFSALIFGTKTIPQDKQELFRRFGLSHIFVISGMHFGIMVFLIYLFVSSVCNFLPKIFLIWPRPKVASAASLIFVALYLSLASPHPSLIRAGLMVSFYLLGILFSQQNKISQALLWSMAFLLLLSPMALFSVSFQLSYLCVFLLLFLVQPVFHFLKSYSFVAKLPKPVMYFINLLVVTFLLNLFLIPFTLYAFQTINLNGLIHNFWAIPAFQFCLIPLLLITFLSFFIFPSLTEILLHLLTHFFSYFMSALFKLKTTLWPSVDTFTPHIPHLIIFYGVLFFFLLFPRKKILLYGMLLLFVNTGYTFYQNHFSYDLKIQQIDVGQGDALLIQTPHQNILIDAGGSPYFDIGEMVLLPYLKAKWLKEIDLVILTHPDTDHYLGLTSLLEHFPIHKVWVTTTHSQDKTYQNLMQKIQERKIKIEIPQEEKKYVLDQNTNIHILSSSSGQKKFRKDNNQSLVFKLNYKDKSFLFTGDISKKVEKLLIKKHPKELTSDYLKIAHHGSKSSSSLEFLKAVSPKIATIGVKERSHFGHPHFKVLERLKKLNIQVFRTDLHGEIELVVKGEKMWVNSFVGN